MHNNAVARASTRRHITPAAGAVASPRRNLRCRRRRLLCKKSFFIGLGACVDHSRDPSPEIFIADGGRTGPQVEWLERPLVKGLHFQDLYTAVCWRSCSVMLYAGVVYCIGYVTIFVWMCSTTAAEMFVYFWRLSLRSSNYDCWQYFRNAFLLYTIC